MTTLNLIQSRTQRRDDVNYRRQQSTQAQVISGSQFRRKLGWGKDRFAAAVRSGRFDHLVSLNASSRTRTVYVLAKVQAWIEETAAPALRAREHRSGVR